MSLTGLQGILLRRVIRPEMLPLELRERWYKRQRWVSRFLTSLRVLGEPRQQVDQVTQKATPFWKEKLPLEQIKKYWAMSRLQLEVLENPGTLEELGTLEWSLRSFIESEFLRQAVFSGVYAMRQDL